jgi:hypothetical protein
LFFKVTALVLIVGLFAFVQPFSMGIVYADEFSSGEGGTSSGPFYLTFTEFGLPNGTMWSVTVNGQTQYSRFSESGGYSSSISFYLQKGTYQYTVNNVSGFSSTPSSGSVSLTSNTQVPIRFTLMPNSTFTVNFVEFGIPLGLIPMSSGKANYTPLNWSVTFNGIKVTSQNSTILFKNVKPGNYSWSVSPEVTNQKGVIYYANPPTSGIISVPNQLTKVVLYNENASVTVTSDNPLFGDVNPSGEHWYKVGAQISISAHPSYFNWFLEWSVSGDVAVMNSRSENTTLLIMGPGTVTAEFATGIRFTETGIPQGGSGTTYSWSVNVYPTSSNELTGLNQSYWTQFSNIFYAYNHSSLGFIATNGTYRYVVNDAQVQNPNSPSYIYTPAVMNGTFNANQQMVSTIYVKFVPGFPVTFKATGLPNGTPWSININGSVFDFTAGTTNNVYLPPYSTLAFSVSPVVGYFSAPQNGTLSISGPSNYTITFTKATPVGHIYSQYSGYFYTGISLYNTFGFRGSWGYATPTGVFGSIGSTPLAFGPPSSPGGYWTASFDMGVLNSTTTLRVEALYSNGSILNYTYQVSVIKSPWWLLDFYNSPEVDTTVSQPTQEWNSPYTITFQSNLALGPMLTVNANLNIISGNYAFVPTIPFTLSLDSAGNMQMSTSFNPNSISVDLGPASVDISGSLSLSGGFSLAQGTLLWKGATVDLKVNTYASTDIDIAGIEVPGTDYEVGIWLTVGAGPDFELLLNLKPTSNGAYDITNGLALMAANVTGGVGVTIGLSVNGGISDVVSAGGGGTLAFMQFVGAPPESLDMGGNVTGTVSIDAEAFGISFTIWQDSGLLYSWGPSNDPAVNQAGNSTYINTYFNLTGYNSLNWQNGEWNGTLLHDVFPYTTFSTVSGMRGDYLFYTYYNLSMPQSHPLGIEGILVSPNRTAAFIPMPELGKFEATGPEAFALSNGSVLLMWGAAPYSEMSNTTSLTSINNVLLQYSVLGSSGWSSVRNVTTSGVANSYTYSGNYALVVESPSLLSPNTSIVEYSFSNGRTVSSVHVEGASGIQYFNPALSVAIVKLYNMSYEEVNLSTGKVTPVGAGLLQVGSVSNAPGMMYELLSNSTYDLFRLYNFSTLIYSQKLPQDALPAYFIYNGARSALLSGAEPSGVNVYLVNPFTGNYLLYRQLSISNQTTYRASLSNGSIYIYSQDRYGQPYRPLYNITLYAVPFAAPPVPEAAMMYSNGFATVNWKVENPSEYELQFVRLSVLSGSSTLASITSKNSSGSYTFRLPGQGDYTFTLTATNPIGNSSVTLPLSMYPIVFNVSGISAGSTWGAGISGIDAYGQRIAENFSTSSDSYELLLPSGNYTYQVIPANFHPPSGSIMLYKSTSIGLTRNSGTNYAAIAAVIAIVIVAVIIVAMLLRRRFS